MQLAQLEVNCPEEVVCGRERGEGRGEAKIKGITHIA
jgi:hypothetical protein